MRQEKITYRHLYIHVPFCVRKCMYCDFASGTAPVKLRKRCVRAIAKEIEINAERLTPETIYIGGGTPSHLALNEIQIIFRALNRLKTESLREFTVEVNPESVTPARLRLYKKSGAGRISIGVQSFDDNVLKFLGRVHTSAKAYKAIQMCRKAGFNNLSLDLIFGIPGTDLTHWEKTVQTAISIGPPHISLYGLTYERGTPLNRLRRLGKIKPVAEETELAMYRHACRAMKKSGYRQYEISNFAKPGFESVHNAAYWRYKPFLGAGPAAASFDGVRRWKNIRDVGKYCSRIEEGRPPRGKIEKLRGRRRAGEVMMLALRERRGITCAEFEERTGLEIERVYGSIIASFCGQGLLAFSRGRLRLTGRGLAVADTVISEFIGEL